MSLSRILGITNPLDYKLHAARWNECHNPLDVFISNREEWHRWNQWISNKNDFNRPYILALMDFYPERDNWLFGGIYAVRGFKPGYDRTSRQCHAYDSVLTDIGEDYIGRLKIKAPVLRRRSRVFKLESRLSEMRIHEILPKLYVGKPFSGFKNASLTWNELCQISRNNRADWINPLSHIQGIYLISLLDGRQYVGSATGTGGIWGRWSIYANTKDGGNALMREANDKSIGKFIENAKFTVLETTTDLTSGNDLLSRESYWKEALGSRVHGLNAN